uniref:Uncharacterized protein n=1 Tax=Rhizophora mucronata TaxID=61149 RepID=A0A2P2NP83_RHIMU
MRDFQFIQFSISLFYNNQLSNPTVH